MPTTILMDCLDVILPVITKISNLSLSTSVIPGKLKEALLAPSIKKAILDAEILKNFRPISNLPFTSKIVEKVVDSQLESYITANNLYDPLQSAYKEFHSTETALVKLTNDILCTVDNKKPVILVLLDLSATFDTVDHKILLHTLEHEFGIIGSALAWIISYLSGRYQAVYINGASSTKRPLSCGVPQGSVLALKLFKIYKLALAKIPKRHGIPYHFYADDCQLYIVFDLPTVNNPHTLAIATKKIEACVNEMRLWLAIHMLLCNDDKTELMLFASRNMEPIDFPSFQIGSEEIIPSQLARNIGLVMDTVLTFSTHVSNVVSAAFFHLKNIANIYDHLNHDAAQPLVHAYVTNKLDNCNSVRCGQPNYLITKLQYVPN